MTVAKETVDKTMEITNRLLGTDTLTFWMATLGDKQFLWMVVVGLATFILGILFYGQGVRCSVPSPSSYTREAHSEWSAVNGVHISIESRRLLLL